MLSLEVAGTASNGAAIDPGASGVARGGLGLIGTFRRAGWLAGGSVSAAFSPNDSRHLYLGALGGASLDLGERLRLDLPLEFGAHRVYQTGAPHERLSPSSTWVPYLGVHPALVYSLAHRIDLGVGAFLRVDLSTTDAVRTSAYGAIDPTKLGGNELGAELRVGVRFD